MKSRGVIGAAQEGTGSDMLESFGARDFAISFEALGRDEFDHREVLRSGAKVLAECEHLAADRAEVVHGLKKLGFGFAEAQHDATLGHDLR